MTRHSRRFNLSLFLIVSLLQVFQNPRPSAWIWTRTLNVLSICEFSRTRSGAFLADCLLCTTSRSTKECKRHELSWFDIAIGSAFWSLQRPSFRSRLRERCLFVSTVSVSCATDATQTAVSDDCSGRFSMQVFNKLAKGPASAGVDREQQHLFCQVLQLWELERMPPFSSS